MWPLSSVQWNASLQAKPISFAPHFHSFFLLLHLRVTEIFLSLPLPWSTKSINQTNDIDSDDSMCQSAPLNYYMINQLAFFFSFERRETKNQNQNKKKKQREYRNHRGRRFKFVHLRSNRLGNSTIQKDKNSKKKKRAPHTHQRQLRATKCRSLWPLSQRRKWVECPSSYLSLPAHLLHFFFCFLDPKKNKQKTEITQLIDWLWAVVKQI